MRKWLLNLHLYGGLLCAAYLLVFGFSSLHFNHHFAFAQPPKDTATRSWEAPLPAPLLPDNTAAAERLRDQLELKGWPLPWETRRDADGTLHFPMERPGKRYQFHASPATGTVQVEEHAKGFWPVVVSLHALHGLPGAPPVTAWGIYTEVCTAFALFAAASGVYLWWASGRDRRAGLVVGLAATALSLGLILYVVNQG
jgi:hypothetical protein